MSLTTIVACWSLTVFAYVSSEYVHLDTALGTLKGLQLTTVSQSKPFYAFRSIPYVKPNIGVDKFRVSEPIEPWSGVLDGTIPTVECIYYCVVRKEYIGDEDCLKLNVYTPNLNKDARNAVFVWIHAGGFNRFSGDDGVLRPDFLVEKDIVFVSMNYRLGPLGFLNTGDENAPGNMGLKDQVMALKWVRDNIKDFGGDPDKVTIGGLDAGAASVHFHMMSPMSCGLFRGGILQSGSALNSWAQTYKSKEMAFKLGKHLGIQTSDSKELVDKLTLFSAEELMSGAAEIDKSLNKLSGSPYAFLPAVETDVGQEVFLPNNPWELLKTGKIEDIPLIIGMNLDDSATEAAIYLQDDELVKHLNSHFEDFLHDDLNITDESRKLVLSSLVHFYYFIGYEVNKDLVEEFTKLLTDVTYTYGINFAAKIISSVNRSPVYKYLFSQFSPDGPLKNMYKSGKGVAHGDEIRYLFYSELFNNVPHPGSDLEKVSNVLSKLWANFIKDGNPTSKLDNDITSEWLPANEEDHYLNIRNFIKMEKGLMTDRVHFWTQMYRDILGEYAKYL